MKVSRPACTGGGLRRRRLARRGLHLRPWAAICLPTRAPVFWTPTAVSSSPWHSKGSPRDGSPLAERRRRSADSTPGGRTPGCAGYVPAPGGGPPEGGSGTGSAAARSGIPPGETGQGHGDHPRVCASALRSPPVRRRGEPGAGSARCLSLRLWSWLRPFRVIFPGASRPSVFSSPILAPRTPGRLPTPCGFGSRQPAPGRPLGSFALLHPGAARARSPPAASGPWVRHPAPRVASPASRLRLAASRAPHPEPRIQLPAFGPRLESAATGRDVPLDKPRDDHRSPLGDVHRTAERSHSVGPGGPVRPAPALYTWARRFRATSRGTEAAPPRAPISGMEEKW